ncbi:MAG: hypothetical protein II092_10060, partial [Lachnospiraceae bacterium]|nr:hypothetical protein [Lachnospiraceae bacterium]
MAGYTREEALEYVRENDVKFIRLAFCDIFGRHKNVSIVGTFATHDQKAPIYYGASMWYIINWLTFVLPMNPYILDGFPA